MKKILLAGLAVGRIMLGMAEVASATSFTFNGNIANHNDVVEIGFSLASDATDIKVWTDSYLSGTNFDPITAVWRQNGSDYHVVDQNDDNAFIAPGQTWYDSGLQFASLPAGNYMFTISTYINYAKGAYLSEGFAYDSQTPIPLSNWNQPAGHYGMGTFYEVHLSGVDTAQNNTAPTPIPGAVWLMGSGLVGLIGARRKKA